MARTNSLFIAATRHCEALNLFSINFFGITAAYWFTSSTSFANPAVTLARAASDTFAGIRPTGAPGFIIAQLLGVTAATGLFCWLYPAAPKDATVAGTVAPSDFAPPTPSEKA